MIAYQGNFHNDKKEGEGREYSPTPGPPKPCNEDSYQNFNAIGNDWVKYEGGFKEGLKDGKGQMTMTNGERFCGTWVAGKVNGKGEVHHNTGEVIKGNWKDDVKQE